jgi:hypothetical protein
MTLLDRYVNPLTDFGFKRIFGEALFDLEDLEALDRWLR